MRDPGNLGATRRALEDLGARITCIEHRTRHTFIWFTTPAGGTGKATVFRSPVDPFKIKGWVRQAFNRAEAKRVEHARLAQGGEVTD